MRSATNTVSTIPPAGALSFSIPEIAGDLPGGLQPKLEIQADGPLLISVAGDEARTPEEYVAGGSVLLTCCQGSGDGIYEYGRTREPLPRLFVIMYNPDLDKEVTAVTVSFIVEPLVGSRQRKEAAQLAVSTPSTPVPVAERDSGRVSEGSGGSHGS